MNLFQYLALLVTIGLLVLSISAMIRGWATRRECLGWTVLWLIASVAIVRPDLMGSAAKTLGIGRGAALVLYCAVVFMFVGFLMVYVRLRRLRRDLTQLVRHLAIREAEAELEPTEDQPAPAS